VVRKQWKSFKDVFMIVVFNKRRTFSLRQTLLFLPSSTANLFNSPTAKQCSITIQWISTRHIMHSIYIGSTLESNTGYWQLQCTGLGLEAAVSKHSVLWKVDHTSYKTCCCLPVLYQYSLCLPQRDDKIVHPSTNQAQSRITRLMETNALLLHQTTTTAEWYHIVNTVIS